MTRPTVVALVVSTALLTSLSHHALLRAAPPGRSAAVDAAPAPGELRALEQRLAALRAEVGTLEERAAAVGGGAERRLAGLADRVERLEGRATRAPVLAPDARATAPAPPAAAGAAPAPDEVRAEFAGLLAEMVTGEWGQDVSPEDQARFWQLARETEVLDEMLSDLEQGVEAEPGNAELRMELADAYTAKLLTVPAGPERGIWGQRAEQQWRDVIELDPDHWGAQFSLAESLSYYPAFLNRTREALAGLERARALQEAGPSAPEHAQTYALLSRMYVQDGEPERAREALESGLLLHPHDDELQRALEALDD